MLYFISHAYTVISGFLLATTSRLDRRIIDPCARRFLAAIGVRFQPEFHLVFKSPSVRKSDSRENILHGKIYSAGEMYIFRRIGQLVSVPFGPGCRRCLIEQGKVRSTG